MSGSRITIAAEDRLDNVHPGDILREDFMIGSDIAVDEIASGTGIDRMSLEAILAGTSAITPAVDARLTRYLRMSDGFFLRLQVLYDVEETKRTESEALDRIVPRAA